MLLYMTTLSVTAARAAFSKLVESASSTHERFEVTHNGKRAAVLMGADDYDGLVETVATLSDTHAVAAIRRGIKDFEAGRTETADEVRAAMAQAERFCRMGLKCRAG